MAGVEGIDSTKATDLSAVGSNASTVDKDAFLQLLVTQMQYQDPMNPSDSTQYMSQLAQFSSLEQMQNMNQNYQNASATSLVGSYVIMKTTDSAGKENYVSGLVDYVTMVNGSAKLSINDSYYDFKDLDSVVDADYMAALSQKQETEKNQADSSSSDEKDKTTV